MNKNLNGFFQLRTMIPLIVIVAGVIFSYATLNTKVEILEKDQAGISEKQSTLQERCVKKEDAPTLSDVEVLKAKMCGIENSIKEMNDDLSEMQKDIKTLLQRNPGRGSDRTSNSGAGG